MKIFAIFFIVSCAFFTPAYAESSANIKGSVKGNVQVKILTLDWTSQIVLSYVTGGLLEKKAIEVEYISSSSTGQWYLLANGLGNIQIESWPGTLGHRFNKLVQAGKIINAGQHGALGREDWWYPLYVKELCPGLPDWRALNNCAHLFSDDMDPDKGQYLAGPWLIRESARIRALSLNYNVVKLDTGEQILDRLKQAAKHKRPIMLYNWSPNWTDHSLVGEFVEFPPYDPLCITSPEWGVSDKWLWDCANPKDIILSKASSLSLPQLSPCAFAIVKAMEFTKQDFVDVASWVDLENMSYQAAATLWLNNNSQRWQQWINQPQHCR